MPRGPKLAEDEKRIIPNLNRDDKSKLEIPRLVNRSRRVIANDLRNAAEYGTKQARDLLPAVSLRGRKLSEDGKRILRTSTGMKSQSRKFRV